MKNNYDDELTAAAKHIVNAMKKVADEARRTAGPVAETDQVPTVDARSLLGLLRKPAELGAWRRKPAGREDLLLTVRRDLLRLRLMVLRGESHDKLLSEVDYTVDMLDNALAEM